MPTWVRVARVLAGVCMAVLVVVCALYGIQIQALNRSVDRSHLPLLAPPSPGQSILIVSPHPDDESLGAAGLLQEAIRHRAAVHVVFMTCGDGFKFGVSQFYKKVDVTPADFKNYGMMRITESEEALQTLGLKPSQITYFGFPDRGLMAMWRDYWNPADPFESPYSQSSRVVYDNAYVPHALFCGRTVLDNLLSLMERIRPTDVYVTHPNDDHDDHSASSAFTTLAVTILKQSKEPWARNLRIHYYLVHRGDWPIPQGYHPRESLAPPAQLLVCDTSWRRLPMSLTEENRKRSAINRYGSQVETMSRFLSSFVRRNEVFGDISAQSALMDSEKSGAYDIVANGSPWPNTRPVSVDPTGDNILLALQKGADIARLSAYHDSQYMFIRMDANGDLVSHARYTLHVRAIDLKGASTDRETAITVIPSGFGSGAVEQAKDGIQTTCHGPVVEVKIPLRLLDAPRDGLVFIEGVSRFSKVPFDRTGPRAIRIHMDPLVPPQSP